MSFIARRIRKHTKGSTELNKNNYTIDKTKVLHIKTKRTPDTKDFHLDLPECKIDVSVGENLPKVSILTITKNRANLFPLAVWNWKNTSGGYPRDRIEWVIIDDSDDDTKIKELLPKDDTRIHYHHTDPMRIGEKRNYGVGKCSGEVVMLMDDDDYYFGDGLFQKVCVLLSTGKKCVFTHTAGIYDTKVGKSAIVEDFKDVGESGMIFYKAFWNKGKFGDANKKTSENEGFKFVKGREEECASIDFWFSGILLTHYSNFTNQLRGLDWLPLDTKAPDFYKSEVFPKGFRDTLDAVLGRKQI